MSKQKYVDLVQMLGVPKFMQCPLCHQEFETNFDFYDIKYRNPNPSKGEWRLTEYCYLCKQEFVYSFQVSLTTPVISQRSSNDV